MQQKKSLKPTLILALDPFAAAFCAEVRARLEGVFGARETLIQARAVVPRDAGLSFTADPAEAGDTAFDLEASRARLASHSVRQVEELFEGCQEAAEEELSELLGAGRSLGDIEAAKRSGFEVVNTRLIYLVLSSVDPFAVGAVLETARLIRWLFATRYADELHTLHALVLLPDLFGNHTAPDHATTYSLFKKLDYAFTNGVRIVHRQNLPPFESCWLMDGRNQRAVGTGTLAENLAGYADAFVGLLSANPEDSMATPGMYARGKPPAYNSFGYGELYFPSAAAVARLSAALAHDITRRTYLGEGTGERHSDRQHLTAVTRFIRSQEYAHALQQVERHQGTAIWRDFSPREEPREAAPGEYVAALRLRHEEFEREQQLEFREALLLSGGRARDDLVARFDEEIDRRADASPAGLGEAVEYLRVMVARAVELQGHLIGEEPQNLWTALRAVKA